MTWHQPELRAGDAFRQQGDDLVELGGSGPKGGIDLMLRKPSTIGSEAFKVNVVRESTG